MGASTLSTTPITGKYPAQVGDVPHPRGLLHTRYRVSGWPATPCVLPLLSDPVRDGVPTGGHSQQVLGGGLAGVSRSPRPPSAGRDNRPHVLANAAMAASGSPPAPSAPVLPPGAHRHRWRPGGSRKTCPSTRLPTNATNRSRPILRNRTHSPVTRAAGSPRPACPGHRAISARFISIMPCHRSRPIRAVRNRPTPPGRRTGASTSHFLPGSPLPSNATTSPGTVQRRHRFLSTRYLRHLVPATDCLASTAARMALNPTGVAAVTTTRSAPAAAWPITGVYRIPSPPPAPSTQISRPPRAAATAAAPPTPPRASGLWA